jgi:hypothetical protein
MTTKKKWVFLRWALALILVLNVLLPVVPAYAEDEGDLLPVENPLRRISL